MTADGVITCTCAGRPAKGRGSQQPCCGTSDLRAAAPAKTSANARRPRRIDAPSNIVALPGAVHARRHRDDALPSGHMAQIFLFTGVQIVRDGTHG